MARSKKDYVYPAPASQFYVTAYIGIETGTVLKKPKMSATSIKNIGTMPEGANFGSDFMFYPFAAVPFWKVAAPDVKSGVKEWRPPIGEGENDVRLARVINYLDKLISDMGVFGKILTEEGLPGGDHVNLADGRWFPIDWAKEPWPGIEFANAYAEDRAYGGPEEGGWWYDAGIALASIPFRSKSEKDELRWKEYLRESGKILYHGDKEIKVYTEEMFAKDYPSEAPRYS